MLTERVESRLANVEGLKGRLPSDEAYDLLLDRALGPARLVKADGRPLCVFLPGAMRGAVDAPGVYEALHGMRTRTSMNRGAASGTPRLKSRQTRSYTRPIASTIAGAFERDNQRRYCRLTAWTGRNMPEWKLLRPVLYQVAVLLKAYVPDRYEAQQRQAEATDPAWVVKGTPFSTITVNNSYATGIHTDKGDLAAGFSTITCLRRGSYSGGRLVFPEYRVGVNLRHGDLILMDAHEWHGNTQLYCACGKPMNGVCRECAAERISVVAYFRERLTGCGTPAEEELKAEEWHAYAAERARARFTGNG